VEKKPDQILERLDRIEKRLDRIERALPGKAGPRTERPVDPKFFPRGPGK
jgi:hypothetical protein